MSGSVSSHSTNIQNQIQELVWLSSLDREICDRIKCLTEEFTKLSLPNPTVIDYTIRDTAVRAVNAHINAQLIDLNGNVEQELDPEFLSEVKRSMQIALASLLMQYEVQARLFRDANPQGENQDLCRPVDNIPVFQAYLKRKPIDEMIKNIH